MQRILLIDDSPSVRRALQDVLRPYERIDVAAEAGDALTAMEIINQGFEGIVVIDIDLPDFDGIETIVQIKHLRPSIPVIVLSLHSDIRYLQRSFKAGASGFVLKERAFEDLPEAIRRVANQAGFVSIDVVP